MGVRRYNDMMFQVGGRMRTARCMVTWRQKCTVARSSGDMAVGRLGHFTHGGKETRWLLRAL